MKTLLVLCFSAGLLFSRLPLRAQELHAFWQGTLARLAREPIESLVEPIPDPVPFHTYRVTLRSLDGVRIRARLSLPIQGESASKPWPAIVTAPGYGGTEQGVMLSECQRGYAILQVYPRSQGDSAELWKIDGPDKLTWHLGHPDGAYYQGAYADLVRGIDFLMSRPDIDHERIGLVGTSQGGGIVLAVGAIDRRIRCVVAHVPALCDIRLAAGLANGAVRHLLDQAGANNENSLRTLDYFDPYQLAPDLKAPALISSGGKDQTCPEATIRAVFDRIPGEKALMYYPDLTHTSCAAFYALSWTWLDFHLRE